MKKILYITNTNNISSFLSVDEYIIVDDFEIKNSLYNTYCADIYTSFKDVISDKDCLIIDHSIVEKVGVSNLFYELATYVRLSKDLNWDIPIFYYRNSDILDHYQSLALDKIGVYGTPRIRLITDKNLIEDIVTKKSSLYNEINILKFQPLEWLTFIKTIHVSENTTNRHSIANQWGAIRLANNCGYSSKDIDYITPDTLYFKFLTTKYGEGFGVDKNKRIELSKGLLNSDNQVDFSIKHGKLKILLIDDNAEKGWNELLEKIFNTNVNSYVSWTKALVVNPKEYDLIFLDLYMPDPMKGEKIDSEISKIVLSDLKKTAPEIPIIIFTASNKSWTYEEVVNLGADGVLIKESPEFASDSSLTTDNFKNFVLTINSILEKYKLLRPYWEAINNIKVNLQISEKEINGKTTMFKERIIERLEMFYGLLKRGSEQRKYNQEKFHLSEKALAFMTLWSVLNEISEACFDKTDFKNLKDYKTKDGQVIKDICPQPNNGQYSNWKALNTEKYLVKQEYEIKYDNGKIEWIKEGVIPKTNVVSTRCYIEKTKDPKKYEINEKGINRSEATREIGSQIAFLILISREGTKELREQLCDDLLRLNDGIRNKLYLTHGDTLKNGFYNSTIKGNPVDISIEKDIKALFNIIAFLTTKNPEIKV